eukprot:14505410-Heterocapsa_arctica.AAC.1
MAHRGSNDEDDDEPIAGRQETSIVYDFPLVASRAAEDEDGFSESEICGSCVRCVASVRGSGGAESW